jgi:hypothetical protein
VLCGEKFKKGFYNFLYKNKIVKKEMGEGDYASHDPDSCPAA